MQPAPRRSVFVTAVAWVFIALSGFGAAIAALQNIVVWLVFSRPEVERAMQQAAQAQPLDANAPPFFVFMMEHVQTLMRVFPLIYLLVMVFILVISTGLLRRRNWARLCFIGFMALSILFNLAGLGIQIFMLSSMRAEFSRQFAQAAAQGGPDMSFFFIAMGVMAAAFTLGFSTLYGWIAKKLMSPPILAEFRPQS